ncbi:MAG: prolyl aminopeptidase [Pseudonocardia sp.]
MADPYPPIEPYQHGLLDVGDGNRVYWEVCGNPAGKPALMVHGGPGSGCSVNMRRAFDPGAYRAVLFDQRGCGRSTPHAADPGTHLAVNTTEHLLADMERLREHLEIERWLLLGGSWGSTLALAYAELHPDRVSEIVLVSVTTSRRSEIDWLYRGAGRFFPEAWERFAALVPDSADTPALLAGYGRLMADPDPAVRIAATDAWCAWEDTLLGHETGGRPGAFGDRPPEARAALTRICAHYLAHGAWLDEGVLLREAGRLTGIPGVLVHGRLDLSGPADTVWHLARAWPDARLHIVEQAGHTGSDVTRDLLREAVDNFARR